MEHPDARSLPGKAQEDLRRRVVQAVRGELSQTHAARLFGVARGTVNRWMGLWQRQRAAALKAGAGDDRPGLAWLRIRLLRLCA